MLIFFLVVVTVFGAAYGYLGWRIIGPAHFPTPWNWIAWIVPVIFLLLPFVQMFYRNSKSNGPWLDLLSWVGYVSMGFFSFVLVLVLLRDLGWMAAIGGEKIASWMSSVFGNGSVHVFDPGRRRFLLMATNLGILGVSAALTGYGIIQARRTPSIVDVDIPIKGLPETFTGFRIVQISDIHAGLTIGREWVEMVVGKVNELGADLIAFTGDLVDGSVEHLRHDVQPIAELKAKHGVYFVTGNHEYYSGAAAWVEEIRRMGLDVLMNEHRIIPLNGSHMVLAGVTDSSGGQFIKQHTSDPAKTLAEAPNGNLRVFLAHQPRSLYQAAKAGFDLMLSGHTHGGQFFPWNFAAALGQPYVAGLHKHDVGSGEGWVYVSRGTGYWGPPLRVGVQSEITVLTLRPA
ncbi:MAG: metallophosphoesterase [Ignavibacteria bacterium]|nr:metallophosphoesterase [Ignavibacteria bacterium]